MSDQHRRVNLRTEIVRAAENASVPLDDFERALILGQIAGLLAAHPKVGGKVAFKGGAIMNLIDGSPRLSRDLDGVLATGGRLTEATIREALSTTEAQKVVKRIERFTKLGTTGLRFPVIACYPLSGVDEMTVALSIHRDAPLILEPERQTITIRGRETAFLVVARLERLAEKIRAFVDRGLDRDAFDLYQFSTKGVSADDLNRLSPLVEQKFREDSELPAGADLHTLFDGHLATFAETFGTKGGLVVMGDPPAWSTVEPLVKAFRRFVPRTKPR